MTQLKELFDDVEGLVADLHADEGKRKGKNKKRNLDASTIGEVTKGDRVICANGVTVHVVGDQCKGSTRNVRILLPDESKHADYGPSWSEFTDVPQSWRVAEVLAGGKA